MRTHQIPLTPITASNGNFEIASYLMSGTYRSTQKHTQKRTEIGRSYKKEIEQKLKLCYCTKKKNDNYDHWINLVTAFSNWRKMESFKFNRKFYSFLGKIEDMKPKDDFTFLNLFDKATYFTMQRKLFGTKVKPLFSSLFFIIFKFIIFQICKFNISFGN